MLNRELESTLARLLAIGVPAVSLFILTGSVSDPVNLTKFLILGAVGVGTLMVVITKSAHEIWKNHKIWCILIFLFVIFSIIYSVNSRSPFVQNLYGVYGRNTGLLTYIFLASIALGASSLHSRSSLDRLFLGLIATGVVNIAYCAWVISFGDFISWYNPYKNILGLFGNPNFIGAFLGIWISSTIGYVLTRRLPLYQWLIFAVVVLIALFEVYKSHAVQGVVVTAAGLVVVAFYLIRNYTKGILAIATYTVAVSILGALAILGALQKGPLASIIYKESVSLRGVYWKAGIKTGSDNPIFGAGMDAYGDWYRQSRSEYGATVLPGPNTVTNSAHNVVLDVFSYGGYPLLISYLGILILGAATIFSNLKRTRSYDPLFVGLSVAWVGYQLQSIISINQIGLAVWGWVLTGALISYERILKRGELSTPESNSKSGGTRLKQANTNIFSAPLIAGIGVVAGLIIATPPISSDMSWISAIKSRSVTSVEDALTPSYLNPSSSERYVNAVQTFESSKLFDLAHKYALAGVKFNPQSFGAWFTLYSISRSTEAEKAEALQNMRRLDPFNAEILAK